MINSTHSPVADVRRFLQGAFSEARLTEIDVGTASAPVLLLQMKQILAAFAFAATDVRRSYDALYRGFKNHYSKQKGVWDSFDLSFVFCVPLASSRLEDFQSQVETDVYFCRKFVIALMPDLGGALARLPFFPLTPLHGRSLRPPSAQTFLQKCNVRPELARWLAVQKEAGPEKIVEECINGRFGEPKLLSPRRSETKESSDREVVPIRLETVEIQNFRAYRKAQAVEIGADVTVLYGPNGFGKTSFFDAIDFAVTGGIGRIRSSSDARFNKVAKHLDSGSEIGFVSLFLRGANGVHTVTRGLGDPKHALFDLQTVDRKTVLDRLTGGDIPATDRVENFINLFRATHLFSQEGQELTKDFQNDCTLSAALVSRMLAFEDYANAVSKSAKICVHLQHLLKHSSSEALRLSSQVTFDRRELERISQSAMSGSRAEVLAEDLDSFRRDVAELGVDVTPPVADASAVRGWRAAIEVRRAEGESLIRGLSNVAQELSTLPALRAELADTHHRLTQIQAEQHQSDRDLATANEELRQASEAVGTLRARRATVEARATAMDWVRITRPLYLGLIEKHRSTEGTIHTLTAEIGRLQTRQVKMNADLAAKGNVIAAKVEALKVKQLELSAIQQLRQQSTNWRLNRDRLATIISLERKDREVLEKLRIEVPRISAQQALAATEESTFFRRVRETERSETEITKAVAVLQDQVSNAVCPLCGADHGTKDELVRKIKQRTRIDLGSGPRRNLAAIGERSKQLAENLAASQDAEKASQSRLLVFQKEREGLESEISQFASAALELGIVATDLKPDPGEAMRDRQNKLEREVADLTLQIRESEAAVRSLRSDIEIAYKSIASQLDAATNSANEVTELDTRAQELRNDPRCAGIPLDIGDEHLTGLIRETAVQLGSLLAEVKNGEADITQRQQRVDILQLQSDDHKAQAHSLRAQIAELHNTISMIMAKLDELKLPAETTPNAVLGRVKEEIRREAHLSALKERATSLELALDAATTAAALVRMSEDVQSKEALLAETTRMNEMREPWFKYFLGVSKALQDEQNRAIDSFTRDYGPRASVIQRRLRTVYGFDDLEIHSKESAISVRVKRNGEELHPTDYYSQSQEQTLLLALFLTACSSQNWSAFSPVFLDDPITHFDDMNTYAFLDLIVGLLDSDFGKRQFIISTCDAKLLQLAQQKFRFLGERAKFHRFLAIGDNGPVVEELRSTSA